MIIKGIDKTNIKKIIQINTTQANINKDPNTKNLHLLIKISATFPKAKATKS